MNCDKYNGYRYPCQMCGSVVRLVSNYSRKGEFIGDRYCRTARVACIQSESSGTGGDMTTTNRMTTLADLEIGNPKMVLNLTAVPLSGNPASALDYLLIDEALETKKVIVEEVSE